MKNYIKTYIKNSILILTILLCLTGCSITGKNSEVSVEEKTVKQLEYVENSIFNIVNKYAKNEYIKDDNLDWKSILDDEKKINNNLDSIILDLSSSNVNNEEVLDFSNKLNILLLQTQAENEGEFLYKLSELYELVPQYLKTLSKDKYTTQEKELKSQVLLSYAYASNGNFVEAKAQIQSAVDKYNGMMNDVNYMKEKSYTLNKTYVLLGEMKNAIDLENIDLTRLKLVNYTENN